MDCMSVDKSKQLKTLQDSNIKVFSILNVPVSEIQKLNTKKAAIEPDASTFNLTSAGDDDYSPDMKPKKNFKIGRAHV